MSSKSNFRKDGFIWAHHVRIQSTVEGQGWGQESGRACPELEREMNTVCRLVWFLTFIQSRTTAHRMELPIFRMGLLTSMNLI